MVKQESECSIPEFLASVLNPENVAALDPWTTSLSEETEYKRAGVKIAYDENLYESLWFGKHNNYETDYRWLHKFCCWALEFTYEQEHFERGDNSYKIMYYFYNL